MKIKSIVLRECPSGAPIRALVTVSAEGRDGAVILAEGAASGFDPLTVARAAVIDAGNVLVRRIAENVRVSTSPRFTW